LSYVPNLSGETAFTFSFIFCGSGDGTLGLAYGKALVLAR
jgi:hypothetical protein